MKRPQRVLFLSDARGVYIPRDFANSWDKEERARRVANVSNKDWAILEAGPDAEGYWDAWLDVCDIAVVIDDNGVAYTVYQDGDCWLIPVGMTWDDEADDWRWPLEQEQQR
jgi:hypothetical protein